MFFNNKDLFIKESIKILLFGFMLLNNRLWLHYSIKIAVWIFYISFYVYIIKPMFLINLFFEIGSYWYSNN